MRMGRSLRFSSGPRRRIRLGRRVEGNIMVVNEMK